MPIFFVDFYLTRLKLLSHALPVLLSCPVRHYTVLYCAVPCCTCPTTCRFSAFIKDKWAEGAGELGKHIRTNGGKHAPWLKVWISMKCASGIAMAGQIAHSFVKGFLVSRFCC